MSWQVIARNGDTRFVVNVKYPDRIQAQEKCYVPHHEESFWHSCGYVLIREVFVVVENGLAVRWKQPRTTCWRGFPHQLTLDADTAARLLVALDVAIETGKAERPPPDISGTPPAPVPAHGPTDGGGAVEGG